MPKQDTATGYTANPLAAAWGEWLSTWDWDCWATLTFRDERSSDSAVRSFHRWTAKIRRESPNVGWFYGTEVGTRNGRLHMHALLGGLREWTTAGGKVLTLPTRRAMWRMWYETSGRAQVLPYDCDRNASYYVAKYVTKDFADYDIEPGSIARRR